MTPLRFSTMKRQAFSLALLSSVLWPASAISATRATPPSPNPSASVSASMLSPLLVGAGAAALQGPADVIIRRFQHPEITSASSLSVDAVFKVAQLSSETTDTSRVISETDSQTNGAAVTPYDDLLARYVTEPDAQGLRRFDYARLKASDTDYNTLKAYIKSLEAQNPDAMSDAEATAYWANLYNAVTIQVVTENYPVTSIRKIRSGLIPGPWKRKLVTVNGEALSLDNIEHGIMRVQFPSPLVHYMVNCASVGCPNLGAKAWQADTLDADRDAAARAFVNSPRGVQITDKGLKVSSIYKWFDEDFGGNKAGVLAHLADYADPELAETIEGGAKIVDYDYDWSLNE